MAVFPLLEPAELLQLHCRPGSQAEKAWNYQADSRLMFVSPGAKLDEDQAEGLFSDRWSMFGRKGDSVVLLCQAKGAADSVGFQVYAGIGNYLELEWVGQAAATGQHSRVEVVFERVQLADLRLECDGQLLLTLGCSGTGLKQELALMAAALRQRNGRILRIRAIHSRSACLGRLEMFLRMRYRNQGVPVPQSSRAGVR